MYYVYILQSLTSQFIYKGQTDNIDRRLDEHFSGKVSSTRGKIPLRLVHVEVCSSRKEARKLEKFYKSGFGREIINELLINKR